MNRQKLIRQIALLLGTILFFTLFNISIYNIFTKRCINHTDKEMQAKSIQLNEYLPFEEDSKIVKVKSTMQLTGDLPIIDGAAALYPVFSAFVHANYPKSAVIFDGENFTENSLLQYSNTQGAYQKIVDGDIDIAICAAPSDEQLTYAKNAGVELEFVPIGRDAFVFLVNAENPINDLTDDQIRGIYSGQYRNWEELGGANRLISPLIRNQGSGSQSAFLNFMGDTKITPDYDSALGAAIGFSFRYYVEGIVENGNVKMISLNGILPSLENIQNGSYSLVNDFYAVYRKANDNKNVKRLVDWMLSEEGQRIVEESGYCPVA